MKKFRNEWKYICSNRDIALLRHKLGSVLNVDSHSGGDGIYCIHSLYFDSLFNKCAMENDAGISNRYKWRIRYYGDNLDSLHLERKEKSAGLGHKDSCKLTKKQYEKILAGDAASLIWDTKQQLLKEFCADILMYGFAPKAIIDYERIAFVEPLSNVRITLDTNIESSYEFEEFLKGDYLRFPVLDKDRQVLEVKFDDILPSHVKNMITSQRLTQTSFSKYYLGLKKLESVYR